ncbi:hypothetical protein KY290_021319 [Solanum tuberosum]|uniref:Uncharacterized protein n=1 Tax=Solanum tuberosum TaxID=4113 RepID=A0ABQ7V165_SOLTU|nr:hypothetical protein KY289_020473 [Solanum tuberosum]KAH0693143.1 hypothetical protein KY285_020240 [Solanum tuberosum]KAH0757826.1 hypothetical protein KY290_021319 [Solanum tuberosum]
MNIKERKDDMNIPAIKYVCKDEVAIQTGNVEERNKDLEGDSSLEVTESQEEEEDLIMRKELPEAHYQTPIQMVEGQYPPDSAAKETLLAITNVEHTSIVNRSNEGQKSPPMEKLHALEDNEEANYDEQATEVLRKANLSP